MLKKLAVNETIGNLGKLKYVFAYDTDGPVIDTIYLG
jgi:hypothetical protein